MSGKSVARYLPPRLPVFPCPAKHDFQISRAKGTSFACLISHPPTSDPNAPSGARRDEALLQKYGLKANDAILAEDKHMDLYEDLLQNHDAKLIAGGSAQNTARGAQVCSLRPRSPAPPFPCPPSLPSLPPCPARLPPPPPPG